MEALLGFGGILIFIIGIILFIISIVKKKEKKKPTATIVIGLAFFLIALALPGKKEDITKKENISNKVANKEEDDKNIIKNEEVRKDTTEKKNNQENIPQRTMPPTKRRVDPEELQKVGDKSDIEYYIKAHRKDYDGLEFESVSINENYGTEDIDDDYIAIVNAKFNRSNSARIAEDTCRMYAEDMAAYLAEKTDKAKEIAIFIDDEYNSTKYKFAFYYKDGKFYYQK